MDVEKLPSDAILTCAFSESMESGKLLPILKEELRLKIQTRRMSKGEPELSVEFEQPKAYPLTPYEKEKQETRKSHNRKSAKKCREKKKVKDFCMHKELERLRTENRALWTKYHKYTQFKTLLSEKMSKKMAETNAGITIEDAKQLLPDIVDLYMKEKIDKIDMFQKNNEPQTVCSVQDGILTLPTPEVTKVTTPCHSVVQTDRCKENNELQQVYVVQGGGLTVPTSEVTVTPCHQDNVVQLDCDAHSSDSASQQVSDLQEQPVGVQLDLLLQLQPINNIELSENELIGHFKPRQTATRQDLFEFGQSFQEVAVQDQDVYDLKYQQSNEVLQQLDFLLSG